ncbi:hypothetical protein PoB_004164900 [Plakobranchus ocellatus]|uniref:Uncharacterized protein n=1 Tax=Plakobranchus ocellatus TaxID=259542 RepID=A0AAV4B8X5_9GAST|nr:hypothetical protein PoB_004164900 [Plakobranchus ocellatus]
MDSCPGAQKPESYVAIGLFVVGLVLLLAIASFFMFVIPSTASRKAREKKKMQMGDGEQYLLEENTNDGGHDSRPRSDNGSGYRLTGQDGHRKACPSVASSNHPATAMYNFKLTATNGLDIPISRYPEADIRMNGQVVKNVFVISFSGSTRERRNYSTCLALTSCVQC